MRSNVLVALLLTCRLAMADLRTDFLSIHNRLRASVVPPAANMARLEWDVGLEKMAERGAERRAVTCEGEHNYGEGFYNRSFESLYKGEETNASDITMKWFMERLFYNRLTDKCNASEVQGGYSSCGHYTAMVDARVSHFGCAMRPCKNNAKVQLVFCEYLRNRDFSVADAPYGVGEPCTGCFTPVPYCHNNLCVSKAQFDRLTSDKPRAPDCRVNCHFCGRFISRTCGCYCKIPRGSYSCRVLIFKEDKDTCSAKCNATSSLCKNGGTPQGANCACVCQPGFSGNLCQYVMAEVSKSVTLIVRFPKKITFRGSRATEISSYIPVLHSEAPKAFAAVRSLLLKILAAVCGDAGYVKDSDFVLTAGFPHLDIHGQLSIAFGIRISAVRPKCPPAFHEWDLRNARTGESIYFPPAFLSKLITERKSVIDAALLKCCGMALASAPLLTAGHLPDDKFGPSEPTGGTKPDTGGGGGETGGGVTGGGEATARVTTARNTSAGQPTNTALIVGLSVGSFLLFLLAVALLACFCRKPKKGAGRHSSISRRGRGSISEHDKGLPARFQNGSEHRRSRCWCHSNSYQFRPELSHREDRRATHGFTDVSVRQQAARVSF